LSNFAKNETADGVITLLCKTHYFKRFHEQGTYAGGDKFQKSSRPTSTAITDATDSSSSNDRPVSAAVPAVTATSAASVRPASVAVSTPSQESSSASDDPPNPFKVKLRSNADSVRTIPAASTTDDISTQENKSVFNFKLKSTGIDVTAPTTISTSPRESNSEESSIKPERPLSVVATLASANRQEKPRPTSMYAGPSSSNSSSTGGASFQNFKLKSTERNLGSIDESSTATTTDDDISTDSTSESSTPAFLRPTNNNPPANSRPVSMFVGSGGGGGLSRAQTTASVGT
jgi:hypothetical protein